MRSFVFHIEKWKGSPKVRSMDAEEKIGYLNLLLVAAEEEDCGIPANPQELAILSELEEQWYKPTKQEIRRINGVSSGEKILGCWFYLKDGIPHHPVTHSLINLENKSGEEWKKPIDLTLCKEGRYYNAVLLRDHQYQRFVSQKKSVAGKIGAEVRYGPNLANAMAHATASATAHATGEGREPVREWRDNGKVAARGRDSLADKSAVFPYRDNFEILWDLWPHAGRARKQKAQELFNLRINEAPNGDLETQFAVILEGFHAWEKSAQWQRGAFNHIANWLYERLYRERPLSGEEEADQRRSSSTAAKNPAAELIRKRLDAARRSTAIQDTVPVPTKNREASIAASPARLGPSMAGSSRVVSIAAERSTTGGGIS